MLTLLEQALAVFFVWEFILVAFPWTIPAWLQPLVVFGMAQFLAWPDWRVALAVGGAVGLLHVFVKAQGSGSVAVSPQVVRRTRSNIPDLP